MLIFSDTRLATAIIRSGAQIHQIRDALESIDMAGDLNARDVARFEKRHPYFKVQQNTREREGKLGPDGRVPPEANVFGFWLPHGLSKNLERRTQEISERLTGAQRIIEIYNETMSVEIQIPILVLVQ